MGSTSRIATTAAGLLFVCAAGQAQIRGVSVARPVPAARNLTPPAGVPHPQARPVQMTNVPIARRTGNARVTFIDNRHSDSFATREVFETDSSDVPGLGFDFVHLAAIQAGRHRPHRGVNIVPASFFELPLFVEPQGFFPAQAQPQIIVIQQPAPQAGQDDDAEGIPRRSRNVAPAPASEAPAETEPIHDVGEFVLLKRDGGVVFAVAFSVNGGQLNYITREGIQRTIPLAAIDIGATQRMNEERGTTIRLPA